MGESLYGTLMREASVRGGESFTSVKLKSTPAKAAPVPDEDESTTSHTTASQTTGGESSPQPPKRESLFGSLMKEASMRGGEHFSSIKLKSTKPAEEPQPSPQAKKFREFVRQASARGPESFADVKLKKSTASNGQPQEETEKSEIVNVAGHIVDGKLIEPNKKVTMDDVSLKKTQAKSAPRPSVSELKEKKSKTTDSSEKPKFRDSCIVVQHEGGAYVVDTKIREQAKKRWGMVRAHVFSQMTAAGKQK